MYDEKEKNVVSFGDAELCVGITFFAHQRDTWKMSF